MASAAAADLGGAVNEGAARAPFGAESSGSELYLLCTVGPHRFAVPMANIIETMRMLPIKAIAGPPPLVCGLSVIRGAAVPVIDTAQVFADEAARYERLVTVHTGERIVAFAASAILGVKSIQEGQREELPPLLRDAQAIAALALLDEELVFFLRAARVLPNDFQVNDDAYLGDS
jgi:purine-binding chemotaxis protein CheW